MVTCIALVLGAGRAASGCAICPTPRAGTAHIQRVRAARICAGSTNRGASRRIIAGGNTASACRAIDLVKTAAAACITGSASVTIFRTGIPPIIPTGTIRATGVGIAALGAAAPIVAVRSRRPIMAIIVRIAKLARIGGIGLSIASPGPGDVAVIYVTDPVGAESGVSARHTIGSSYAVTVIARGPCGAGGGQSLALTRAVAGTGATGSGDTMAQLALKILITIFPIISHSSKIRGQTSDLARLHPVAMATPLGTGLSIVEPPAKVAVPGG